VIESGVTFTEEGLDPRFRMGRRICRIEAFDRDANCERSTFRRAARFRFQRIRLLLLPMLTRKRVEVGRREHGGDPTLRLGPRDRPSSWGLGLII